ncbi:MAG TPA: hypothetical protein VFD70_31210 [Anaerolineae bacterium]|nr:hypothetical protein [Anaerolineae bacterium]
MTETRFTWRWLLVIALIGIVMGVAVGLIAGWVVFPNIGGSNVAGLSTSAQNDYIVLVANTYAYDQDATRAKQRLAQLQDKDIKTRVERLAKSLAVRKDTAAANVADLAVALGSEDSSLQVLAQTIGGDNGVIPNDAGPTKVARGDDTFNTRGEGSTDNTAQATPTAAPKKKKTTAPTAAPTEAPTEEPTEAPTPVVATKPPPPTAEPTQAPPQAAPVTTEFIPAFPDLWWDAVSFNPANVAPGQQYWHLKYARYCDWAPTDKFQKCPGFPEGGTGTSIHIMTVDENGGCIRTEVTDELNDGSHYPLTPDVLKKIDYPWNPYGYGCDVEYQKAMYGEGNSISVPGLPSDKINALSLCAKNPPPGYNPPPCGHAHVRYFLIFQRTTR